MVAKPMRIKDTYLMIVTSAILLMSLAVSCSHVEVRNEGEGSEVQMNPTETRILFGFDWSEVTSTDGELPVAMTVAMSRIKNTVHYVYWLDREGQFIDPSIPEDNPGGNPDTNPDEGDNGNADESATPKAADSSEPEDGTSDTPEDENGDTPEDENGDTPEDENGDSSDDTPEELIVNTEIVGNGDYYAIAIAHGTDDYKYTISGLDEFATDLDVAMTTITATVPILTKEEITASDLLEFNPTCPYIHSADPLYSEVKKFTLPPLNDSDPTVSRKEEDLVLLTLRPNRITRELTFRVYINHDEGVTIESLTGVISGVPRSISMMTGIIAASERRASGKVHFSMEEVSSDGQKHTYEGKVGVLGLFPADDPAYITGPGILQLFVRASAIENDVRKERLMHAGLNIYDLIKKADLMILVDEYEKSGYRSTKDATLDVNIPLTITRTQVISGSGQGLVEWKDNDDDINLEV